MSWLCAKCGEKLARAETKSWRCTSCGATFTRASDQWSPESPMFAFDSPWFPVTNGKNLEEELARELTAGHPLHGKKVRALARHGACDDVVFAADDGFYVVHLTWKGGPENDPRWPSTSRHASIESFAADEEDDDASD